MCYFQFKLLITMKFKSSILIVLTALFLFACGNKVEKGTLMGRTASIIENNSQIVSFSKVNVKTIIEKSGVFNGALPAQYLAFIKVYKNTLYSAINVSKPIHILVAPGTHKIFATFEVKDLKKLDKELSDLGCKKVKKDNITYFSDGLEQIAIAVKNNFGLLCFQNSDPASFEEMQKIIASSEQNVKNEKLAQILSAEDDISVGMDLYRLAKTTAQHSKEYSASVKKYINDTKDSYTLSHINFNQGEANIKVDMLMGKAMMKHKVFKDAPVSSEALSSIGNFPPIIAVAANVNYEHLFILCLDLLPKDQKNDLKNKLAMVGGAKKVANFFTGEFALATGDLDSSNFVQKIGVFATLKEGKYLQSLVSGFSSLGGLTSKKDNIYVNSDMALQISDRKLVYTTYKDDFDKMMQASCEQPELLGGFTLGEMPLSGYINFNKMDTHNLNAAEKQLIDALNYATIEGNNENIEIRIKSDDAQQNILRNFIELGVKNFNARQPSENQMAIVDKSFN